MINIKEISNTNLTLSIECVYLEDYIIRKRDDIVFDTIYLENDQFNKINITYELKDDFIVDDYIAVLMFPTFKSSPANINESLIETIFNTLDKEFEFKSDKIMIKIYIRVFTGDDCAIQIDNYIEDTYNIKRGCYPLELESKFSYERGN